MVVRVTHVLPKKAVNNSNVQNNDCESGMINLKNCSLSRFYFKVLSGVRMVYSYWQLGPCGINKETMLEGAAQLGGV